MPGCGGGVLTVRIAPFALFLAAILQPAPAVAQSPEELEQIEPDEGETQIEIQTLFPSDDADSYEIGIHHGWGERTILGMGIELEREDSGLAVEEVEFAAIRLLGRGAGVFRSAVAVSAAVGRHGGLSDAELRLISESKPGGWWIQGNLMLRHERNEADHATGLAYAANVGRAVSDLAWLGVELSGAFATLQGDPEERNTHFAGLAGSIEVELAGGRELELGVVQSRRISGHGPLNAVRLFAQFTL